MKFIILSYSRDNTINLLDSMHKYSNINIRNKNIHIFGKENITNFDSNFCDIEKDTDCLFYGIRSLISYSSETVCLMSDKYIYTKNPEVCSNYIGRVLKNNSDNLYFSYSNGIPSDTPSESIENLFTYKRQMFEPFFSFNGFVYRPYDIEQILSFYTSHSSYCDKLESSEKTINSQCVAYIDNLYNMTLKEPCLQRIAE